MKWIAWFKREPVLTISGLMMLCSALLVPPDRAYWGYLDFRTLGLLFSLMAVVGEAREQGIFDRLCCNLSRRIQSTRGLLLLSALLPFFLSMLVTNDVALITLVPLLIALTQSAAPELTLFSVVLATVAANLGSAATPFGNPQNLYLSSFYSLSPTAFFTCILPFAGLSLLIVALIALVFHRNRPTVELPEAEAPLPLIKCRALLTLLLFLLCIAAVLRLLPWYLAPAISTLALILMDRRAFRHVDWGLLVTFVFFFIFVGNVARIPVVSSAVSRLIAGRALLVSALFSQIISNVPAALMLSSFTLDARGLLLGTNIGGLGTPVASMASLISLGFVLKHPSLNGKRYLILFSMMNFALLILFLLLYCL